MDIDNVDIININSKIWLESNITYLIPNRPNRFYKKRLDRDFLSNNKIQNQSVCLNMINFYYIC
jgi:hypothetical protein